MNLYGQLQQISLDKAICAMAELALPRGSEKKVMKMTVLMRAINTEWDREESKSITFIFYRPGNYMFVGITDDTTLHEFTSIKKMSYHDSCWRDDGVKHAIKNAAQELAKSMEGQEKMCSVFNTFNYTPIVKDGHIEFNDETAKFVPLKISSKL